MALVSWAEDRSALPKAPDKLASSSRAPDRFAPSSKRR